MVKSYIAIADRIIDSVLNDSRFVGIDVVSDNEIHIKHLTILKQDAKWTIDVLEKAFNYKQCAVGFAVAICNSEYNKAQQILFLDKQIFKLSEDVYFYKKSYNRNTDLYNARLSNDLPKLKKYKQQLLSVLRSVKFSHN